MEQVNHFHYLVVRYLIAIELNSIYRMKLIVQYFIDIQMSWIYRNTCFMLSYRNIDVLDI